MPRVAYIHREIADEVVMDEAMRRLRYAGNVLATKVRDNLRAAIKNPNYSRPPYKTGKYAGKWWTARDAGELLKSVRVTEKEGDNKIGHRNLWVMCGNSKAYWAAMYEYSQTPTRGKKFFRPAIASARNRMKSILENGD